MKASGKYLEANMHRSPNNQATAKVVWIEAFKRLQAQGVVSANIEMIEKDRGVIMDKKVCEHDNDIWEIFPTGKEIFTCSDCKRVKVLVKAS